MADTTSAAPSERDQFEEYAKQRGYRLDRTRGGRTYLYAQAAFAWRAWRAARAAPPPQPVAREQLTDEQVEAAAKMLAQCMDYPWQYMPEQGRNEMRKHARSVIAAACHHVEKGARDVSA